jgi:hypothetical protein
VGFNEKAKAMNELQNDATKKMQQLAESKFLYKISWKIDSCME